MENLKKNSNGSYLDKDLFLKAKKDSKKTLA
jgi:hypothetical protein